MSQLCKLAKGNKFSQSTSSFSSGPGVGDSSWTIKSMVTNVATGALFGLISLFSLSVLFGLPVLFGSGSVFATASSITITQSAASAHANIPPTSEGKFVATGTITFGVTTSHAAGYTASASATALSFVDTAGINGTVDATYTIAPLATGTAITAEQFAASTGTAYTNKWGYLPTTDDHDSTTTIIDNDKYLPAPIDSSQTLDTTAAPNPSTANDYDITVGARVDHTLEQGQYTTTFTFAVVGNPTPYTINYNANATTGASSTVTNMPTTPETSTTEGETTTISSTIPVRTVTTTPVTTGYVFAGWCTVATAPNATCSSVNGTEYGIGGTYALDQTSSANELTLYAMWDTDPCYGKTKLHDLVTCQVKKDGSGNPLTQDLADMQAVITEPTSQNPAKDTSNSGVYLYDASYFGAANDNPDNSLNTEDVYYFRGILDNTFAVIDSYYGSIPSTGDSAYYHNYVRLHDASPNAKTDTCWRIIRTTATGGIKMVYNGKWDSTNNTCANARADTLAGVSYINRGIPSTTSEQDFSGIQGFMTYAGYNYNSTYAYNNTSATTAISNSILFNNETASRIRTKVEDWYANTSNLINYSTNNKLETSAGWCNDRTTTSSPSIDDKTIPYDPSASVKFGSSRRGEARASLTCPNITGYDLLTTSNGLGYPLALPTSDEMAFNGLGLYTGNGGDPTIPSSVASNHSPQSFLVAKEEFWLLSPQTTSSSVNGIIWQFRIMVRGYASAGPVSISRGFRPAISLVSSTTISSGSGTSTDPWVITP